VPLRPEHNIQLRRTGLRKQFPKITELRVQLALLKRATSPNNNQFSALKTLLSDPNSTQLLSQLTAENKQFLIAFVKKYKQQIFGSNVPNHVEQLINPQARRTGRSGNVTPQTNQVPRRQRDISAILSRVILRVSSRFAALQREVAFLPSTLRTRFSTVIRSRQQRLERDILTLKDPNSSPTARTQAKKRIQANIHILGRIENYFSSAVYLRKASHHRRIPVSSRRLLEKNLARAGELLIKGKVRETNQILLAVRSYIVARRAGHYRLGNVYYRGLSTNNPHRKMGYFVLADIRTNLYRLRHKVGRSRLGRSAKRGFNRSVRRVYARISRRLRATLRRGRQLSAQDHSYIQAQIDSIQTKFTNLQKTAYKSQIKGHLKTIARYSRIRIPGQFRTAYTQVSNKAKTLFEQALRLAQNGDYAGSQRALTQGRLLFTRLQLFHGSHTTMYRSHRYAQKLAFLSRLGLSRTGLQRLRGYMYSRRGYSALNQLRGQVLNPSTNLRKLMGEFRQAISRQNLMGRLAGRRVKLVQTAINGRQLAQKFIIQMAASRVSNHAGRQKLTLIQAELKQIKKDLLRLSEQAASGNYRNVRAQINRKIARLKVLCGQINVELVGRPISYAARQLRSNRSISRLLRTIRGRSRFGSRIGIYRKIAAKLVALRKFTTARAFTQTEIKRFKALVRGLNQDVIRGRVFLKLRQFERSLGQLILADYHYGTFGRVIKNLPAAILRAMPAHNRFASRGYRPRSALDVRREMRTRRIRIDDPLSIIDNKYAGFVGRFSRGNIDPSAAIAKVKRLATHPVVRRAIANVRLGAPILRTWEKIAPYLAIAGQIIGTFTIPYLNTMMESGFGSSPQFRKGKSAKWSTIFFDTLLVGAWVAKPLQIAAASRSLQLAGAAGKVSGTAGALRGVQGIRGMLGVGQLTRSLNVLRTIRTAGLGGRGLQALSAGVNMANTAGFVATPFVMGYSVYDNWDKMGTGGKILGTGFTVLSALLLGRGLQTGGIQRAFRADALRLRFSFMSNAQINARLKKLTAVLNGHLGDLARLRAQSGDDFVGVLAVPENAAAFRKLSSQFDELSILMGTANGRGLSSFSRIQINGVRGMGVSCNRFARGIKPGLLSRIGARFKGYYETLRRSRVVVVPGAGATPRPAAGALPATSGRSSGATGLARRNPSGVALERSLRSPLSPIVASGVGNSISFHQMEQIPIGGRVVRYQPKPGSPHKRIEFEEGFMVFNPRNINTLRQTDMNSADQVFVRLNDGRLALVRMRRADGTQALAEGAIAKRVSVALRDGRGNVIGKIKVVILKKPTSAKRLRTIMDATSRKNKLRDVPMEKILKNENAYRSRLTSSKSPNGTKMYVKYYCERVRELAVPLSRNARNYLDLVLAKVRVKQPGLGLPNKKFADYTAADFLAHLGDVKGFGASYGFKGHPGRAEAEEFMGTVFSLKVIASKTKTRLDSIKASLRRGGNFDGRKGAMFESVIDNLLPTEIRLLHIRFNRMGRQVLAREINLLKIDPIGSGGAGTIGQLKSQKIRDRLVVGIKTEARREDATEVIGKYFNLETEMIGIKYITRMSEHDLILLADRLSKRLKGVASRVDRLNILGQELYNIDPRNSALPHIIRASGQKHAYSSDDLRRAFGKKKPEVNDKTPAQKVRKNDVVKGSNVKPKTKPVDDEPGTVRLKVKAK
jgi:hypothetical protein